MGAVPGSDVVRLKMDFEELTGFPEGSHVG